MLFKSIKYCSDSLKRSCCSNLSNIVRIPLKRSCCSNLSNIVRIPLNLKCTLAYSVNGRYLLNNYNRFCKLIRKRQHPYRAFNNLKDTIVNQTLHSTNVGILEITPTVSLTDSFPAVYSCLVFSSYL